MNLIPTRLGPKLNFFLLAFLVVLGTATALLMVFGFRRTQDDATNASRDGLETQGRERLSELAGTTAGFGQLILAQATTAGGYASDYMTRLPEVGGTVPWDEARMAPTERGAIADLTPGRVSDAWAPDAVAADPATQRDLAESAALDAVFPSILAQSPEAIAVYFTTPAGVTRYYPARDYVELPAIALTTPQRRALAAAAPDRNPGREAVWTEPYPDPTGDRLLLTAYTPVFSGDDYRGVIGVDLAIDRLIAQADGVQVTPNGFAFVLDRNGELLRGEAYDVIRAAQADETNSAFDNTLRAMREGRQGVDEVTLAGEPVLVAYAPLPEIGGSIAVAAPVEEVIAQSSSVASAIRQEGNRTIGFTIVSMAALFMLALAAFAWMNRNMLVAPIQSLVRGTRDVAAGDLEKQIPVTSNDELGILADSFNAMTSELRMSRGRLESQQAQIVASENELRALFNAMTDAVLVVDRDGRYLRAAPTRYDQAFGDTGQVIGRTLHDVYPPDQADALLAPVRRAIDTGEVQEIERQIPVPEEEDRWFSATISRLNDESALTVVRDITARKVAERTLVEQEEQYRSVFEEANDALFVTSLDGRIVDINPAAWKMHGYTRDELMRLSPLDFIHPEDHGVFEEYIAAVAQGRRYRARARDIRKDGSVFYVEVVGAPITYGGLPHVLGVVRDVTEQVQQEKILEQRVDARTRELASLLEVSRAISSTLELKRLAQLVLEELESVAHYDGATLAAVEGDHLVILDSWGPFRDEVIAGPTSRVPVSALETRFFSGLRNGEPILIDDVLSDEPAARAYRRNFAPFLELPSFRTIRSWIAMPLLYQDRFIGMLTAAHTQPGHFSQEIVALMLAAASQATVAIENARLFEQTTARTRELTSLLEVSRNVAAQLEVGPLLELMLDEVHAVAPFERAAFLQMSGDEMTVVASRDVRPERAAREIGARFFLDGGTRAWLSDESSRPVIVDDILGDSREARAYRNAVREPALGERYADIRSWMAVPLRLRDRPTGMLTIARSDAGYYTERHGQLATAIASQAAVALENARLFQQTEERTRELASMLEVTRNVASTLQVEGLLDLILNEVDSVAPYQRAAFMLHEGDELISVAARDEREGWEERQKGARYSVAGRAAIWDRVREGHAVIIDDVRGDSEMAHHYRRAMGIRLATLSPDIASWMAVPLRLKDRVAGMLSIANRKPSFYTERHAQLVEALASQAAVALENARLFEQTEARTRELEAVLRVSTNVATTLELDPLLRLILDQMGSIAPYTRASLFILEGNELVLWDSRADTPEGGREIVGLRVPIRAVKLLWEALSNRRPVLVDDVHGEEPLAREYRNVAGEMMRTVFADVHAWVGVPLSLQDRVIGAITLSHPEPGFYNDAHARVAMTVANQAAVAIENARLYTESERRASEMTGLVQVSHAIGSTLEVQPLLALILSQLQTVVPYYGASVMELRDQELHVLDWQQHGVPLAARMVPNATFSLRDTPGLRARFFAREAVVIDDMTSDEEYAGELRTSVGPQLLRSMFGNVRSWALAPMSAHDHVIGLLAVSAEEPAFFTPERVRLISLIANQAAIALENASLYEESQARTRELAALLEVSGAVASTLELRPLATVVIDQLKHVIEYDGASLLLLEDQALTVVEDRALDGAEEVIGFSIPLSRAAPLWDRLRAGKAVIIKDALSDEPYAVGYREVLGERFSLPAFQHVRAWMAVPLTVQDRVIGMMSMSRGIPDYFTPRHVTLARAIADQAAVAIENARLYEQAQQLAAVEERQRLARELHDSVSQALYGVALGSRTARTLLDRDPAKAVEPIEYVMQLAEAGLAEMRALIFELRPESLELEGLVAGLEKQAAALRARHHIEVDEKLCKEPEVPITVKAAIQRIAQEAMHNTVKHARATRVELSLHCDDRAIELEVRDNGRGFDPTQPYAGHLGLRSMRERAAKLGGTITMDSAPGEGASIKVTIPVNGAQP